MPKPSSHLVTAALAGALGAAGATAVDGMDSQAMAATVRAEVELTGADAAELWDLVERVACADPDLELSDSVCMAGPGSQANTVRRPDGTTIMVAHLRVPGSWEPE